MYWHSLFIFRVKFVPGIYFKKITDKKWTIVPPLPFIKIISLCLFSSSLNEIMAISTWRGLSLKKHGHAFPVLTQKCYRQWRLGAVIGIQSLTCVRESSPCVRGKEHTLFSFSKGFISQSKRREPTQASTKTFFQPLLGILSWTVPAAWCCHWSRNGMASLGRVHCATGGQGWGVVETREVYEGRGE